MGDILIEDRFGSNPVTEYLDGIKQNRKVTLHTGAGGADLFCEQTELQFMGMRRVYMTNKVPRFLRVLRSPIRKSYSGRYYKLVKA